MNQQEIVEAVKKLLVGYDITWDDIKYDADKAIYQINDRLGAKFPEMSKVLQGPQHHYAIMSCGKLIPIFDRKYILTVVIPFIAMEILARDEEFTTVYNKYNLDFNNNLYLMYSNEYNRIPPMFIQDDTTGVFFTNEEAVLPRGHNSYKAKPDERYTLKMIPKVRLTFNLNDPKVIIKDATPVLPKECDYGQSLSLPTAAQMATIYSYSHDGNYKYSFDGWYDNAYCNNSPLLDTIVMDSDKEVFAKWKQTEVFRYEVDNDQGTYYYPVFINEENMYRLVIPSYIQGMPINELKFNDSIKIPDTVQRLAFGNNIKRLKSLGSFQGTVIEFPDIGNIEISAGAIDLGKMPNVRELHFHRSVTSFSWSSLSLTNENPLNANRTLTIYFDYSKSSIPSTIDILDNGDLKTTETYTTIIESDTYTCTVQLVFNGE